MNRTAEFKKAWKAIDNAKNIFLTTHENTDGDDLGSLLGLMNSISHTAKKFTAAVKGGVPKELKFLPGSEKVSDRITNNFDLVITFGCSNLARTGFPEMESWKIPLINFDHHPDNTNYGQVNVVDASTAAVAELVYYFLKYQEVEITQEIATCLLTGIFTDTGGFKHANTSASVLQVASELMRKGARVDKISSQTMGKKRPEALKLWARGLENTRFDEKKKLLFSIITEEDIKETSASSDDLAGFVEFLNNIPEARFVMVLRQDGDLVRGNLRSDQGKNVDVSKIAHAFGGGGHKLASGFKIKGKLIRKGNTWKILPR